jgi:hypothetical protein
VAIIGAIFVTTLATGMTGNVTSDPSIPPDRKTEVIQKLQNADIEGGQLSAVEAQIPADLKNSVSRDVGKALASSSDTSYRIALYFTLAGAAASLFITEPKKRKNTAVGE